MLNLYGFDANNNMRTLPRGRAWRFSRSYAYITLEILVFWELLNSLSWDRVSIADYNEVCQLYEAVRLKLAWQDTPTSMYLASVAPPAGRGQGFQRGGRAGHKARHWPIIVKEIEESSGNDSEETTSYIS
ncbi:hypothetical protein JCGZ_07869 [Jatropha curcas]|uniref:Uncharacterized protein n=1 Tax=Jatropha curcas TaxID=180498 RepID=A0A067KK80_JATCU|nr:hypothetical protein JCGZ_07869 [Jatropha curcas]